MKKLFAAALACCAVDAAASCGTAFCMVNTSWNVQGVWTEPGARVDLRFEYIDQDQPRAGSRRVGVGAIAQHHDEVRTVNRNWLATFDYTFSEAWGVSATLPVLDRDHAHIPRGRAAPRPVELHGSGRSSCPRPAPVARRECPGAAPGLLRRDLRLEAAHRQGRRAKSRRTSRRAHAATRNRHRRCAGRGLLSQDARFGLVVVCRCPVPGAS
jgi:hypothetical protein